MHISGVKLYYIIALFTKMVYLQIKCNISILTPFNTISSQIEEKVILAENVIIGEIPENYLDIGNLLNANKNN